MKGQGSPETGYAVRIFQDHGKKCENVKGEYLEKK
jgi:hypothetical protein